MNVIYFPQIGFLIVVPINPETQQATFQNEDWEFQFYTATSCYFKSPQMHELDDYFGDIHCLIVDREIELVHDLQMKVMEHSQCLIVCSVICAELDW
jgi:DNA mismatch repair protein MSH5